MLTHKETIIVLDDDDRMRVEVPSWVPDETLPFLVRFNVKERELSVEYGEKTLVILPTDADDPNPSTLVLYINRDDANPTII